MDGEAEVENDGAAVGKE
ncbi:hypothetical protein Gotri_017618, partial [Gossypium trilobum]|nr:hypothetical protein [Gossypium trilobum]